MQDRIPKISKGNWKATTKTLSASFLLSPQILSEIVPRSRSLGAHLPHPPHPTLLPISIHWLSLSPDFSFSVLARAPLSHFSASSELEIFGSVKSSMMGKGPGFQAFKARGGRGGRGCGLWVAKVTMEAGERVRARLEASQEKEFSPELAGCSCAAEENLIIEGYTDV